MTALVVLVAAGMAAGNGPEKVSTEADGFDLRGEWTGTFQNEAGAVFPARYARGELIVRGEREYYTPTKFVHQRTGRLLLLAYPSCLGIYKWEGDRLFICIRVDEARTRPTAFKAGGCRDQLTILRRVK
jgi:hypothetical protein